MLEVVRKAARKIYTRYLSKFDRPVLFCQATPISEEFAAFLGGTGEAGPMTQAVVVGTHEFVTFIRTSGLDHARGPVPCQPFEVPGSLGSAPREWDRVVKAVMGKDVDVSLGYGQGAGAELVADGKVLVAGKIRWPVLTIEARRRKGKLPEGERAMQHEVTTRGLADLAKFFVVQDMAGKEEVIHLRTEDTGHLMRYHPGILEYRGRDVPVVLRSSDSSVVSFIQPSPPPPPEGKTDEELTPEERAAKREEEARTEEDLKAQRRLPGFEDLDEGGEDEGE